MLAGYFVENLRWFALAGDRESVVWGEVVEQVGLAPAGVKWVHVDDRGADDFEVFCRIQAQGNNCVIRAARLHRWRLAREGSRVRLEALLQGAFDTFGIAAIGLGWTFGRHFSESGAA